jgi:hypothetical protein
MQERRYRGVPARLARLEKRFSLWRRQRVKGARIPPTLWKLAVASANQFGVSQTATVLKLDYYGLKKRLEQQPVSTARQASSTAFVEVPSPAAGLARECVIEFQDGRGAWMRVQLNGTELPDLLALGRSFWKGE